MSRFTDTLNAQVASEFGAVAAVHRDCGAFRCAVAAAARAHFYRQAVEERNHAKSSL
jgi:ferritin